MAAQTRAEAWNRLGNLISEVKKFVDEKLNIHREVKRLLASVGTAFNRLKALEESTRSRKHRPSGVETRDAETSPIPTASHARAVAQERIEVADSGSDGDGELTTDQMLTSRKSKRKTRDSPGMPTNVQKKKKEWGSPPSHKNKPLHPGNKSGVDESSDQAIRDSITEAPEWQLVKSKKQHQQQQKRLRRRYSTQCVD